MLEAEPRVTACAQKEHSIPIGGVTNLNYNFRKMNKEINEFRLPGFVQS
jgi:hypothetical protein